MRWLGFSLRSLRLFACVALMTLSWSSASFSQGTSVARIISALPSVQAQLVFEGAQLANQQMSSFRLATKLSPERLIAEVESLWSKNEQAKVWRTETDNWLMVSKIERFPEVEVLQARRSASGETIARLSVGSPSPISPKIDSSNAGSRNYDNDVSSATILSLWLPENSRVLQSFISTDPGKRGYMLIARTSASLKASLDWIEARAKLAGFRADPHLRTNLGSGHSFVAVLLRGPEEVILTLDRDGANVAIVLQHSQVQR